VAQLLKQGAIADIHDLDDVTPLHLAMKKHDYQSVLLLLSRSTDSLSLFNASTWRKLLPGPHSHIEISIGQSTTIRKIPESEIRKNYPIFHFPAASSDNFDDIMASEIDSKRLL
jgi:ankyrin repeat protein